MVVHELTGINAVMLYSNIMLSEGGKGILTPRQGVVLLGIVNLLASFLSIYVAKTFTRRALFVWGHLAIGLAHIAVGATLHYEYPTLTLVSMCAFLIAYENSSGCITWLYCSEVAVDGALGLVGTTGYSITFLLALLTQPLMISPLRESGTFVLFGVISLFSALWCHVFLKETSTCKTDKEKKELYVPEDLLQTSELKQAEMEISMGFAYGNSIELELD